MFEIMAAVECLLHWCIILIIKTSINIDLYSVIDKIESVLLVVLECYILSSVVGVGS